MVFTPTRYSMQANKRTISYNRPKVTGYQERFMDDPARYGIIQACTKSGKTTGCLIWLLEQGMTNGRGNYWWVAPVYAQADIAFKRLKDMLRGQIPYEESKGDRSITLPNGAVIWFKNGQNPDNLYGEDVKAAVMDEATRIKADAWYAVRSTLTATGGPVRIIGNVKGRRNWVWKLALQAEKYQGHTSEDMEALGLGDTSYFTQRITALDVVAAGLMRQSEYEDAKANLPDHVFRELYMAEPTEDGSNPFGGDAIRACTQDFAPSDTQALYYGIDLGKKRDYTTIVGLNRYGHVVSFTRFQDSWNNTVKRIIDIVGTAWALVDSTGVGDAVVDFLLRSCPRLNGFVFTSNSKQQLMEGLALAIQNRTISFPEGVITEELEEFEYSVGPNGKVQYSAPEGYHDDAVCGLALVLRLFNSFSAGTGSYDLMVTSL